MTESFDPKKLMLPIYLASPYSDDDWDIRIWRAEKAAHAAVVLSRHQIPVYAPIPFWHNIAEAHEVPTDAQTWKRQNRAFLEVSAEVWVLKLPGFMDSVGVKWEVGIADELKIPVKLIGIIDNNYYLFPRGNFV